MEHGERCGVLSVKEYFKTVKMCAIIYNFQLVLFRKKDMTAPKLVVQLREAEIRAGKDAKFSVTTASHKNATHEVRACY